MNENPFSNREEEAYRVSYLIAGYIKNTLNMKEHQELDDWVNASDDNMLLFEELTDENNIKANLAMMDKVQSEKSFKRLQQSGAFNQPGKKRMRIWLAAASVILLAGLLGIYLFTRNNTAVDSGTATVDTTTLRPGGNRATLSLGDGVIIDLANTNNGTIQSGKGSHVVKPADGELVYEQDALPVTGVSIHTLSTPVGGQYQVTLPDGTKIWLNAATTLKYPAQFAGDERKVELDGEAFFEVAKNEKKPFRVLLADSAAVTVLGTQFNVMAYQNENAKEITLVEGKVTVKKQDKTEHLLPGMQAKITGNAVSKMENVDTEEITGWKDGLFVFHDASIESVMRQAERWYDAKIIYKGDIKQQFNATIRRSEPLAKLLHLLELNGYVKFKTENKTIYVFP